MASLVQGNIPFNLLTADKGSIKWIEEKIDRTK